MLEHTHHISLCCPALHYSIHYNILPYTILSKAVLCCMTSICLIYLPSPFCYDMHSELFVFTFPSVSYDYQLLLDHCGELLALGTPGAVVI